MPRLQFLFKDIVDEINAIAQISRGFVDPSTYFVFQELVGSLQGIQDRRSQQVWRWGINRDRPIRTAPSNGEYNPSGRGKPHIYAEITSAWDIRPLISNRKSRRPDRFELAGLASTVVRLVSPADDGAPAELGMWRMEIASDDSPGCHFHVQVRGEDLAPPFPKAISVPRLPVFPVTPTVALEFVLGELFQIRWPEELSRETDVLQRWRSIQSTRLERFLLWQHGEVTRAGALSAPWPRLKRLTPQASLFIDGAM